MTSVQFLFATMDGRLFAENAAVLAAAQDPVVVNQLVAESPAPRDVPATAFGPARVVSVRERGLARSRNRAIAMSDAEIGYLCDDDIDLVDAARAKVAAAFERHPRADVLIFALAATPMPSSSGSLEGGIAAAEGSSPGAPPGPGPARSSGSSARSALPGSLLPRWLRILGAHSIQIAFRRAAVQERGLRFDERFGLGAPHPTGEEAIFLADCLRAGLRIEWTDEVVARHPAATSGSDYSNPALAEAKGAVLARIFGGGCRWLFLPFALRSRRLYRDHIGLLAFLRALERGARDFLEASPAAELAR